MASLAEIVKTRRMALNITQEDLAERIGVDRSYIGHVESRRMRFPSEDILRALSVALDVPMDELAAAAYEAPRVHRPRPDRTPAEIVRELDAALRREQEQSKWLAIPKGRQRISGGPGNIITEYEYLPPDRELAKRIEHLETYTVSGDCMAPRIEDGDSVVADNSIAWKPGDVVVALHDGEAIIKRLARKGEGLQLVALQGQPPIDVDESTSIVGVVVRVIKRV